MAPGRCTPLSYISSPRRRTRRTASSRLERARRVVRRELAERVASRARTHVATDASRDDRPHRGAVREQRRLRVVRERELLRRPLEAEPAERRAERGIGALEHVARRGERVGEVLAHAGLLRALARETAARRPWLRSGRPSSPT